MDITADALHTQRAHAEYLHARGAEFVLTVKQNQPTLFAALDTLPWVDAPIAHRDVDTTHGRVTTRTIQILPTPTDPPFPHVNQVWLIERHITGPTGTPRSAIAALGLTSLTDTRATPEQVATHRLTKRRLRAGKVDPRITSRKGSACGTATLRSGGSERRRALTA